MYKGLFDSRTVLKQGVTPEHRFTRLKERLFWVAPESSSSEYFVKTPLFYKRFPEGIMKDFKIVFPKNITASAPGSCFCLRKKLYF